MFKLQCFILCFSVAVVTSQEKDTQCHKIKPDTSIDLKEKARWFYCRSGDKATFCVDNIEPLEDQKSFNNSIGYIDSSTNQPAYLDYVLEEQDTKGVFYYLKQKVYGAMAAVSEDKQCFAFMKCAGDKSSVLYLMLCREGSQCEDQKKAEWFAEETKKTKGVMAFDDMKNSYELCKAAKVV